MDSKVYRLHALSLSSGSEKFGGPVVVTGTVPGTGWDSNNGQITLEDNCYQRNGLALNPASNAIYISFGHCNHGWMLAYDKASLQQTAILNVTPDGAGGGLWGGTPAIDDSTGDLYLITGVDLGDPAPDYNDSAMRLRATDLSILDYFKPSNEAYLRQNDADFGSGSPIIMPDNPSPYPHELIGGGKDGRIFVINRDNMGQFQTTDHVIQEVQTGTQQFDNIFATPTLWNGTIYYHCENDVVKAYSWDSNSGLMSTSPISRGTHTYGTHGATSSLSANGSSDGILWEIESTNVDNGGPAILRAYDPTNLRNELYNSQQAGGRDVAGPAVKVYRAHDCRRTCVRGDRERAGYLWSVEPVERNECGEWQADTFPGETSACPLIGAGDFICSELSPAMPRIRADQGNRRPQLLRQRPPSRPPAQCQ